jgi:glycosyltransferase involved in cell wall biosynthesis
VSIIIPSKDAPKQIKRCLQSIFARTTYLNYEIIVIDNGTTDKEALQILTDNRLKVIPFNEKFNYSKANNLGVKESEWRICNSTKNDIKK